MIVYILREYDEILAVCDDPVVAETLAATFRHQDKSPHVSAHVVVSATSGVLTTRGDG